MSKLSHHLLIFTLIFAPLAFGSVEHWSQGIMEGAALFTLILLLIRKGAEGEFVEVPGIWPLVLFMAYILLQLVPLPPGLVKIISPSTHGLYSETVALFDSDAWMSLTVNRKDTLSEFFRFSAYAALYIATIQLLTDKVLFQRTIYIIAGYAAFFALIAILQHFTSDKKILWFLEVPRGSPFGTYVNRNHYAGFMGMLLPVLVSLFLCMKPEVFYTTFRERIVEFFSDVRGNIHVLLGFSSLVAAASVFLCLSRGGIVSVCISLSFLGVLLAFRGKNTKSGMTLCIFFLSVLFSVGWFGWDPIFDRFKGIRDGNGEIEEARLLIWQDSRRIIGDFPVTGTGFGTFNSIFPAYRSFPGGMTYSHSHNDYIELATDGGVIAYLLVGWFLVAVCSRSIRLFRKRRDLFSIYLFAGSFAGLFSMLLHSLTDFNLHIGANGLYFFLLLGLMVSAAHTRLRGERAQTLLKKIPVFPARWVSMPVGLICCGALLFNLCAHAGDLYLSPLWRTLFEKDLAQDEIEAIYRGLDKAILLDPLNGLYPLLKANTLVLNAENADTAGPNYEAAIRLQPSNGSFLQELALFNAQRPEERETTETLFQSAIKYQGTHPDGYKEYGLWLLEQHRSEEGFEQIRRAICLVPARTKSYIELLVEKKLTLADIAKVLPDRVQPHLIYADYMIEKGDFNFAELAFSKAVNCTGNEAKIKAEWFYPICRSYEKAGRLDNALSVVLNAIEHLPENTGLRLKAASLYEKLKITYRAQEEYNKVLFLDPNNKEAQKRLAKLTPR